MKHDELIQALVTIYVSMEDTSPTRDVRDSRPRQIPQEIINTWVSFIGLLEKQHGVEKDSFILEARPYIRRAIGLSGTSIGYDDEGLTLAQMVSRASPTGWGVQYQSDIPYYS